MGVDIEELEFVAQKLDKLGSPLSAQIVRDAIYKIAQLRIASVGTDVGKTGGEKAPAEEDTLLTEIEVAALCRVSTRTIQGWRTTQKGPPLMKLEGTIRYSKRELKSWMDKKRRSNACDCRSHSIKQEGTR